LAASTKRVWSINGDFLNLAPTGVARYGQEVTRELDRLVAEGHPLTQDLSLDVIASVPAEYSALSVRVAPEFKSPRLPQFWVQAQLPREVRGGLLSFCNLAPVAIRKHIVCIHDLHTFLMPESYGRGFRLAHKVILPALGRRAARITTVSEFSKQQLVSHGIAPAEKIFVTYNGADHAATWRPELSKTAWPEGAFVLALGRPQPYKNAELLWKLAPLLEKLGVRLVVAGDLRPDNDLLSKLPRNVDFLGRIDDDTFAAGLDRALAFVFPSRIEGFGLPAAEAMMRGCPVIASTSPCLPEICADAALFADPDDAAAWAAAIASLLSSDELRADYRARSKRRACDFSWRRIAENYLELMWSLDGRGGAAASGAPSSRAVHP
jgi:glycosyltransferase involved in cell wall biosynthesis